MSTPQKTSSSFQPKETAKLLNAFKQFSLETERLESTYGQLEERFKAVQLTLQESHTRLSGKLAELDFVSRYLETILDHMSQGILFIDLKGIVTTYNATAQKILQIPENELLMRPYSQFFDNNFFGFSLEEILKTKQSPKPKFLNLNRDRHHVELEIEATFVSMSQQAYPLAHKQAASQPIQGLLILLRDITKLRCLERSAHLNSRLKELGELAAHLAHELRNPLGGIKGFATLLQHELQNRPDLIHMASSIAQGVDDLNHFVSKILHYARPFHLHIETVDLVMFIHEMRNLMLADPAWKAKLIFTIKGPVSVILDLDPQLIKSALLNLFVNAVQAMPHGGELTVTLSSDSHFVTINIEDTGCGISQENMPKIFSPFFTTKETGTGLGLAEVQKAVQAHQGWIEVQSQEGKWTCFTIKLPLKLSE